MRFYQWLSTLARRAVISRSRTIALVWSVTYLVAGPAACACHRTRKRGVVPGLGLLAQRRGCHQRQSGLSFLLRITW